MTQPVVRFGNVVVNTAARTLVRDGEAVTVAPLVFDVIVYLIQHRDRAVGRDELVAAVWGKVDVSDAALGKTILTARRAIGDDGEAQRYLRTVPRFGYRWSADTQAIENTADAPAGDYAPAVTATDALARTGLTRQRRFGMAAAIAAAVALALLAWLPSRRAPPATVPSAATADRPVGVAVVLPADVAASADDAWLRLGLMDMLGTRLAAAGVPVLPSDNVVRLAPAGIARDAALAAVRDVTERGRLVVPVARREGSAWIVRAELLDGDGEPQAVEARADNVVAAARDVADALLERLGHRPPRAPVDAGSLTATELSQRIDAARLARAPLDARALIDAAPAALQQTPAIRLRRAQIALDLGESEAAREQLEALIASVSAETDPVLLARANRSLAVALSRLGRPEPALAACDRAIALLAGRDLPGDVARAYNNRGIVHLMREEYDLAAQDFARARVAADLAVDSLLLAQIEGNEANLQAVQGRYAEVAAIQERVGRRFERFGMTDEYARSLVNVSTAQITLLRPVEALETSARAMALVERVQHVGTRLFVYLERANALELVGRLGDARAVLDRAVQEANDDAYAAERAIARAGQARLELGAGQPTSALALARQALAALPAPVYNAHRAGAWITVVRSLDALARVAEAADETQRFAAWAATSNDASVSLFARLAQAEQAAAERRDADARAAFDDALAMARRWSAPDVVRETVASYARYLLARGDTAQASAIAGLIARHADVDYESALLQAQLYRALNQEPAAANALAAARRLAGERVVPALSTAP
ncbi:winged helix-turn-helix domain-containing protein [Tahibacter soli]|uniref:Winged helix-turn-helix domain-containing protein n=1 Tax=Tahibacter soli TaxID=2983605 RepID=A0A9X3YJD7_9GAMM|nr:winged helix-turn-helix domain-containing protein [Tahibacter soli]MDC8013446.1 winged helix-turn-helix domain-containing protein [Tahibacter soli]